MNASGPARPGRWAAPLLLAYAALVLLRMPEIVLKGRFWAEEGTVFLVTAFRLDPVAALLEPYGGYLNLVANAATLAARWAVPLEAAPWVTTGVGLLFQLLPPLLWLTARDAWLQPWRVRLAGLALLLLVPGSDEIWLQTLHCQFELALGCGLILALEERRGARQVLPLAVLVLAPLCGPGAIALTPLFLLRALLDRTLGRSLQFAALVAGSAFQMVFFFSLGTDRGYTLDPALLLAVVTVKDLLVPLLGTGRADGVAARIHAAAVGGHVPLAAALAPVLVFGAMTAAIARTANRSAFWLLAGAAATALSAYIGALDGTVALLNARTGARYAIVPLSLTALAVLALAAAPRFRLPAAICCAWLLLVGLHDYVRTWPPVRTGPAWPAEVARWRADPAYVMQIWPQNWTVRLPPP